MWGSTLLMSIIAFGCGLLIVSPLVVIIVGWWWVRRKGTHSETIRQEGVKATVSSTGTEVPKPLFVPWVNNQAGWLKISFLGKTTTETIQKAGSAPNLLDTGTTCRRAKEAWFAMLVSDTLRLYDSEKSLTCRTIIKLSDYRSLLTPTCLTDDELYKKDNPIRLQARDPELESYLLYADSSLEKESWYTSLVVGCQLRKLPMRVNPFLLDSFGLKALREVFAQPTDSNSTEEENRSTQWLNLIVGRLFLSVHRQPSYINSLITKLLKIVNKVPKPHFLSDFTVTELKVGTSLPQLSRPNLLQLSEAGELEVELDLDYTGGVQLGLATVISSPFSAFPFQFPVSVNLKLRELHGRLKLFLNRPPSNRVWISFTTLPSWDLDIHPTLGGVTLSHPLLSQLLARLAQGALHKNLVSPRMEDICFLPSSGLGGIFDLISEEVEPELVSDTSSCVSHTDTVSTTLLDPRDTTSEIGIQLEEVKPPVEVEPEMIPDSPPPVERRPRSSSQSRTSSPTFQSTAPSAFNDFLRQLKKKPNVFNKKSKPHLNLSPYATMGSASLSMPNLFGNHSSPEEAPTRSPSPPPVFTPQFHPTSHLAAPSIKSARSLGPSPKLGTPSIKSARSASPSPKSFLPSLDTLRATFHLPTKLKSKQSQHRRPPPTSPQLSPHTPTSSPLLPHP